MRRRAPVVGGARNAYRVLGLTRVRRFFARFKKSSRFQRSNRRNAGCHRTAGYQPAMSAKREHLSCGSPHGVRAKHPSPVMPPAPRAPVGSVLLPKCRCCGYVPPVRAGGSAFVLPTTDNDLSKNPIVTAPGSDLANADSWRRATIYEHRTTNNETRAVRRQLFDDIMKRNCGVMGIFSDRRRFPKNAYFSQNSTAFPKMRTFPKATRLSRKCVRFSKLRGFPDNAWFSGCGRLGSMRISRRSILGRVPTPARRRLLRALRGRSRGLRRSWTLHREHLKKKRAPRRRH